MILCKIILVNSYRNSPPGPQDDEKKIIAAVSEPLDGFSGLVSYQALGAQECACRCCLEGQGNLMLPRRLLVSKKYMSDDISSIQCIDSNLNWIKMLALCYWNMSFSMCFIECVCSYYVYLNRHLDVNTNSKNNKQSTHTHTEQCLHHVTLILNARLSYLPPKDT